MHDTDLGAQRAPWQRLSRLSSTSASAAALSTAALQRRRSLALLGVAPLALLAACGGGGDAGNTTVDASQAPGVASGRRSWKMGFGGDPPKPTLDSLLANIGQWSRRAEFAVMQQDLPWAALLAGAPAATLLQADKVPLASHYRRLGLQVVFVADPNDGLSRGEDASVLRSLGRSMREPAVQTLYRQYVLAVARMVQPDVLCLVPESNLVRLAAPAALYAAIRDTANAAAADLRSAGFSGQLMTSVQVEVAWGLLAGDGSYRGITTDLADFPYTQALGLSSYPYFVFSRPEDIPADHYSRITDGSSLDAWVVESGWLSAAAAGLPGSADLQARYVNRHAALLDSISARGVAQLVFADPDFSALPQPVPAALGAFATLGMTDTNFVAKPALAAWDSLFARPLATR